MVFQDKKTSQDYYKVKIPLWNVTIQVPLSRSFRPAIFTFPRTKILGSFSRSNSTRLKLFDFWIGEKALNCRRTAKEIISLAKNKTSETSMRHMYVDNKPEFQIYRVEDGDTEIMLLKDGTILLETKEDSSKESSSAAST